MIGNFPLGRLTAFPGMGVTPDILHKLADTAQ